MNEEPRMDPNQEDDHDVLTYTQVESRLTDEIAATEAQLNSLRSAPQSENDDNARLVKETENRLELLRTAARRNARQAGTDGGRAGFLGYRGPRSAG